MLEKYEALGDFRAITRHFDLACVRVGSFAKSHLQNSTGVELVL